MEEVSLLNYIQDRRMCVMDHMTAKVSCFARAYHTRVNEVRIFSDEAAYALLGEDYERIAENMMQGIGYFLPGFQGSAEEGLRLIADRQLSPSVLARSAFAEEHLAEAVREGCRQYVIPASGYDTFGIRNTDPSVSVYELDLPELIEDKKERIRKAGLTSSSVYVQCDLSKDAWTGKLMEAGFDPAKPAYAGLLGISYYLESEEFRTLLKRLGQLMKGGLRIAFDVPMAEAGNESRTNRELAKSAGEAMKARYRKEELQKLLADCGYEILVHPGPKEMTEQYLSAYNNANPEHRIEAPAGVDFILAETREE